jgi:hypothetical protein
MQTPPSVKGHTKAMIASARMTGTLSAGTSSGAHRSATIAPTLLSANHDAWRANSTPTRSDA